MQINLRGSQRSPLLRSLGGLPGWLRAQTIHVVERLSNLGLVNVVKRRESDIQWLPAAVWLVVAKMAEPNSSYKY